MPKRARRSLVAIMVVGLLLLSVVALSSCGSSTSGTSKYGDAVKIARTGIWGDINSGKASSGDVAILDNGKVVYSEGFGTADRETSTPVTTTTLFNMGSVSKVYCTAALMKLVDDKKIKLDSPVVQYLPEFKMADRRYRNITVRMLVDHQSGLPGTTAANDFGYKINPDFYAQVLANLAQSHLKADPGFSAPYCNDGFTLAEMVVAKVSGQKYIDYLTSKILDPLSLSRTGLSVGARPDAGVAAFYQPDTGKKVPPEAVTLLGAGGLSSTAEELVRFGDSFSAGGQHALSQAAINEMTKPQPSTFAKDSMKQVGMNPEEAYGLGFDAVETPAYQKQGIKLVGKGGDTLDYHSELLTVPDKRISVAVMEAGHGGPAALTVAYDVLDSVLEAKGLMKKESQPVAPPLPPQTIPAQYQSFAGLYDTGTALATLTVDSVNNAITMTKQDTGKQTALIYNNGSLYTQSGDPMALISVDGRSVQLQTIPSLWTTVAEKIPATADPQALRTDINGSQWLRRNVKPYEAMDQTSGHVMTSSTNAGMALSVIRDLTELNLLDKNGQTWAQLSDMLFSPSGVAAPLNVGQQSDAIGKDGYNEWLKTAQDVILDVNKPNGDRVIVFSPDGSSIYDSVIDSGKVYVPAGDFIELAGSPGHTFKVTATTPSSK